MHGYSSFRSRLRRSHSMDLQCNSAAPAPLPNKRRAAAPAVCSLLPVLSCVLLTGGVTLARADEAAKTDTSVDAQPAAPVRSDAAPVSKSLSTVFLGIKPYSILRPAILTKRLGVARQDSKETKQDTKTGTGDAASTQGQGTAPAKPGDQPPAAPAPAAATPGTVTITGLADVYYGINVRAPKNGFYPITTPSGETIRSDNFGEFFNINDREPSFNLGEVNINRTEGRGIPFGITATLTFGDAARLYHATEPGGTSSWQTLHNLYISKGFRVLGRDASVDFGKWATPIGLEVLESSNNDNYSRAFDFWYGVPFYHAGVRATVPLTSRITVQGAVVNGWNNVADDNDAKTVYGLLTLKPNPRLTANFSAIGGAEGTGAYGPGVPKNKGSITTNLFDANAAWQALPRLKFTGWVSYGSAAGDNNGTHISGNWLGLVAGTRYQLTSALAVAGRLEQFEDIPGTGGAGPRFGLPGYLKMREVTLTLEYITLRNHLVTRLEYRHDHANATVFGAGAGTTPDQDTIYVSEVVRF